jgi:hypothetical protein
MTGARMQSSSGVWPGSRPPPLCAAPLSRRSSTLAAAPRDPGDLSALAVEPLIGGSDRTWARLRRLDRLALSSFVKCI